MKLSTRGEYGLRAMLFLALQAEESGSYVHAQTISEAQAIPPHYLKQILIQLRGSGLVSSTRGPSGGHSLARAPKEITVGEILACLEGEVTGVESVLAMPCRIKVGPDYCVIKELLLEVKARVEDLLESTSLRALAQRQNAILDAGIVIQQTTLMRRFGKPRGTES